MRYSARELARLTGAQLLGTGEEIITQIVFDTRLIFSPAHTAFIALSTSRNEGGNYLQEALDKGIKTIICTKAIPASEEISFLITEDPREFLRTLAKAHLSKFPQLKTIGITGSNGKTIIKEWLYQCLWNEINTVKSPKSYNSQIGLPLSLLNIEAPNEIGIFEVGISKPGEMEKQAEIFSPEIGIFTHLGTAHLENFINSETLLNEKLLLFRNSQTIVYSGDNELTHKTIKAKFSDRQMISYGLEAYNSVTAKKLENGRDFSIRLYSGDEIIVPFHSQDSATVHNALAVVAALELLGTKPEAIVQKLNALHSVEMRMETIKGIRNNLIINDTYNLDLDSLKIALEAIGQYHTEKKILVLTDVLDVKSDLDELYATVASLVNARKFDAVFLLGDEIPRYQESFHGEVHSFRSISQLLHDPTFNKISNSLILLKGARKFFLELATKHLELQSHDTILEVNLDAILHNVNFHRAFLKPETKMMAMVKAFSYGMGSYEIAEFLQLHQVDYLTVAYADEGKALRLNNITLPIMVMNPEVNSYETVVEYALEPEIYSFKVLHLLLETLRRKGIQSPFPIHIKLETGMHRLGFVREDLDQLLEIIAGTNLRIASVFTHLSCADDPAERAYTLGQISLFQRLTDYLFSKLDYRPLRHCLNSAGITNYPEYQLDMVRLGIGMIGYSSNPRIKTMLRNALSFKTIVTQIAPLKKGESLGYNRKYIASEDTRIATIAVGYADGVPRLLGNGRGEVGIRGRLFPIQGNICMDMLMVDIGDAPVKEGDSVTLFNDTPSLENFANLCNTIPYEVITSISQRVKRVYIKE